MKKLIVLSLSLALLTGCASTTTTRTIRITPVVPPMPPMVNMEPVDWKTFKVNETNVFLAIDPLNYENLARNMNGMAGYIEKLRYIIYSVQTTNFVSSTNVVTEVK